MFLTKDKTTVSESIFWSHFKCPCSSHKQFSLKDLQVLMFEDFVFCPWTLSFCSQWKNILQRKRKESSLSCISDTFFVASVKTVHTLVMCLNGVIFFNNTEFVQLLHTDRQFQMKVGGITASVFAGALLAGRGRKYFEFFCNLPLNSQDCVSESLFQTSYILCTLLSRKENLVLYQCNNLQPKQFTHFPFSLTWCWLKLEGLRPRFIQFNPLAWQICWSFYFRMVHFWVQCLIGSFSSDNLNSW